MAEPQEASAAQNSLFNTVFETRTMISFRVRDEILQEFLPDGWRVAADADGPAKGANFRLGPSDQLAAIDEDGNPTEVQRFCPLTITAINDQLVRPHRIALGSFSTALAPGLQRRPDSTVSPPAAPRARDIATLHRAMDISSCGEVFHSEGWDFKAGASLESELATGAGPSAGGGLFGESLSVDLAWRRGDLARAVEDFRVYAQSGGRYFRQYYIEKVEDLILSRPLNVDFTTRTVIGASGPLLSRILDGEEELISISVQPFARREIYLA